MNQDALQRALLEGAGNPALLDPATGALSREAFILRVEEAAALGARLGHGIAAVVIEVQWPPPGTLLDAVLGELVDRVWAQGRRSDSVARLAVNRLGLLLPATDRCGAARTAARLERLLSGPCRVGPRAVWPRLSLKVAGTPAGQPAAAADVLAVIDPW